MTEWEDCKYDGFFTLNLTKNDNSKRYNKYEYDRKWLLCTVNMFAVLQIPAIMKPRSIYAYSTQIYEKSFSVILILVVTFTVFIFGQI